MCVEGVTNNPDAAVSFHVKYLDGDEDVFPSFTELDARDFPMAELDANNLLPSSVFEKQLFSPLGDNVSEDLPISTFQVTFIKGGFIIGVAIHHNCSDGPGCDGFLTTWAENSAAAKTGQDFKSVDAACTDRSRLSAVRPDSTRWKDLDGKFPVLKDLGGPPPPPPAGFKMPPLASRMWHFPKSSLAKLKAEATPAGSSSTTWVSTYDVVMAILWKTVTRAKIPLLQPDLTKEVVLVHAVNTRNKLEPPLPERLLGNAVALPRVKPVTINQLLEPDNLPALAAAVRTSIQSITPQYVSELPEWVAGLDDKRWITIDMDSFLGMDLAGTSWAGMNAYTKHDFGFGLPKALRWPNPAFEGYVFVLPSRIGVKTGAEDEGIEVCVCLEQSCADRLMVDSELLKYAQPRI